MALRKRDMLDWAEALCSNEHVQARHEFEAEYDYGQQCCVAVLAEQADEADVPKERMDYAGTGLISDALNPEKATFMALGLSARRASETAQFFMDLNDEEGLSYEDIADIILSGKFPNAPDMT